MNTFFRRILLAFTLILIGWIVVVQFLPKPKLSFTERQMLIEVIEKINNTLPGKIGTLGQFDKVSLKKDTLVYHYTVYGNEEIAQFYEDNYSAIRKLLMYVVIVMNGQHDNGSIFSSLLNQKGLIWRIETLTPNGTTFRWNYEGWELQGFLNTLKISPTEAFCEIIDTHIKLANLSLPLQGNSIGCPQTITTNAITQSISPTERLIQIYHEKDNIIFIIETSETEFTFEQIREMTQAPLFIDGFTMTVLEDADCRVFMTVCTIAHSNFTYRFRNQEANDSVDIFIPYSVLKKYCDLPTLLE